MHILMTSFWWWQTWIGLTDKPKWRELFFIVFPLVKLIIIGIVKNVKMIKELVNTPSMRLTAKMLS